MSAVIAAPEELAAPSPGALLRRRVLGHTGLLIGAGVLAAVVFMALAAPLLAPYDPYDQDLARRLIPPIWHGEGTWAHPLGTDMLGRDYLSRLIYGARISLLIGFAVMLISGLIGTALGVAAGYFGGKVDLVVTYLITVRLALPVILVLGLLKWDRFAVVMRSTTMQVRGLDYVVAARATGCSTARIVLGELLPNVADALVVVATLEMASAILLEAALSFLGLGVQPPLPSWGLMISEAKSYMFFSAWLITIPGAALLALVLAINLLGDGIRDVTAPEGRN